jgi:hypothetical protein
MSASDTRSDVIDRTWFASSSDKPRTSRWFGSGPTVLA